MKNKKAKEARVEIEAKLVKLEELSWLKKNPWPAIFFTNQNKDYDFTEYLKEQVELQKVQFPSKASKTLSPNSSNRNWT